MKNERLRQCLQLIKNGVTEETAFNLDDHERLAWCIQFSEMEGGRFNFRTLKMEWPKP